MLLQSWYDDYEEKRLQMADSKPDLTKLRPGIFQNTDIGSIDWEGQSSAVIQRIFERGNETEREEIVRFYGPERVDAVLASLNGKVNLIM